MSTKKVQPVPQVPPFSIPRHQRTWLEKKKLKTGDSFASILRGLIQNEIDTEAGDKK